MTDRSTTSSTATEKRSKGGATLLAGGAALMLALGLGIGTWQVRGHHGSRVAAVQTGPQQPASAPAGGALAPVTGPTSIASLPTVLLVSTPEQATAVQAALDDADLLRRQFGAVPLASQILVVDPGQAVQAQQMIAEENQLRASLGLPEIAVTDLSSAGSAEPVRQVCSGSGCLVPG